MRQGIEPGGELEEEHSRQRLEPIPSPEVEAIPLDISCDVNTISFLMLVMAVVRRIPIKPWSAV